MKKYLGVNGIKQGSEEVIQMYIAAFLTKEINHPK